MGVAASWHQVSGENYMAEEPKPDAGHARTSPGARGAKHGADARRQPEKQKENQQRLGVDADHKTAEMKKRHRGTFP
jgi:hypothetical protein